MKTRYYILIKVLFILTVFILSLTSCVVVKTDNGRHLGWYKGKGNPHKTTKVVKVKSNNGKGNTVVKVKKK